MPTITSLYAGLASILIVCLAVNVSRNRFGAKIGLGDGGNAALLVAIRMHGNAVEYLPLSLLLMALVEIQNGLAGVWLHIIGILLLLGRAFHLSGLTRTSNTSSGRRNGIVLTWMVIVILAVINILLFFGI